MSGGNSTYLVHQHQPNCVIASGSAAIFCTFASPYKRLQITSVCCPLGAALRALHSPEKIHASFLAMTAESILCLGKCHSCQVVFVFVSRSILYLRIFSARVVRRKPNDFAACAITPSDLSSASRIRFTSILAI